MLSFFFFFQAEDGIRDLYVTGVQTCALPILPVVSMVTLSNVVPMMTMPQLAARMATRWPDRLRDPVTQPGHGSRDERDGQLRRRPGKTAVEDAGPDTVPGFPGSVDRKSVV